MRPKVLALLIVLAFSSPAWAGGEKTGELNVVSQVTIEAGDDGTWIIIEGSTTPTYSVFKLSNPLRLFVDISNSRLGTDVRRAPVVVDNGVISSVALMEFSDEVQQVARLIIGFDRPATYDVKGDGNRVVVFVAGGGAGDGAQASGEIERHQREIERARGALAAKERRLADTERQVRALERSLRDARVGDNRAALATTLAVQRRAAQRLRVDLADREAQITRLELSLTEFEARVAKSEADRDAAARRAEDLKRRLGKERADLAKMKSRMVEIEAKRAAAEERSSVLAGQRDEAAKKARALEGERDRAAQRSRELARERDAAALRAEALTRERNEAQERAEFLASERIAADRLAAQLAAERDEATHRAAELARKRGTAGKRSRALAVERDEAKREAKVLAKERDAAQKRSKRLATQRDAAVVKADKLERARAKAEERSRKLAAQRDEAQRMAAALTRERDAARSDAKGLERERNRARERARVAASDRDAANAQAKALTAQRDKARDASGQYARENAAARKRLATIEKELKGTKAEFRVLRKERKAAIAAASGLRDDIASLRSAVVAKDRESERARGELVAVEKRLGAVRKKVDSGKKGEKARLVSIEKERDAMAREVLALQQQLIDASNRIAVKERELTNAIARARVIDGKETETREAAVAGERERTRQAALARKADKDRRRSLEKAHAAEGDRLSALESARAAEENRLSSYESARAKEEQRLDAVRKAREAEERRLKSLAGASKTEERRLKAAGAARKAEEKRLRTLEAARAKEEARLGALEKVRAAKEQRIDSLERARSNEEQRLKAVEQSREAEQERLTILESARNKEEKRLAALATSRAVQEQRISQLEKARAAEENRLSSAASARINEERRLSVLENSRRGEEARLAEAEGKLEAVRDARKLEEKRVVALRAEKRTASSSARPAVSSSLVEVTENGDEATLRIKRKTRSAVVETRNTIKAVRFQQHGDVSRIIIELNAPGDFETIPWSGGKASLIIKGAKLPKSLQRTLDTQAFGGTVRYVSSYQQAGHPVTVEAHVPSATTEIVRQNGNELVWEFSSIGAGNGVGAYSAPPAAAARLVAEPSGFTAAPPRYVATPRSQANLTNRAPVWQRRPPGIARKRVDIELRGADIQNVLRLLAREGGINIVAADNVSGTVTLKLKNVLLADAFVVVLKSLGLGFEKEGEILRVAPAEQFEEEASKRRKAIVDSFPLEPLEVVLIPVNYAEAFKVSDLVGTVLSSRGSVEVDQRTNTLVIKDVAQNLSAAQQLVRSLDTQTPQILIEGRIVETNDRYRRQIGIQWGGEFIFAAANGNPTGLAFPSSLGVAGAANDGAGPSNGLQGAPNYAVNLPAPIGTGSGGGLGIQLGSIGGGVNLSLRLSALEEQGAVKIISAPRILTLDNESALISQGVSIPISQVSAAGVQTAFVEARLELLVKPHVTQDGNIIIDVAITKSEPDFENTGARGDPTIVRREAKTRLLLGDGDTTVIGGIYSLTGGSGAAKVPFLGDIPILGWFFRDFSETELRSEMLIFLTPRVINREAALNSRRLNPIISPDLPGSGGGR
jgi:type IV pilus assembly protein PilQ